MAKKMTNFARNAKNVYLYMKTYLSMILYIISTNLQVNLIGLTNIVMKFVKENKRTYNIPKNVGKDILIDLQDVRQMKRKLQR